jgi:hypothetical protein
MKENEIAKKMLETEEELVLVKRSDILGEAIATSFTVEEPTSYGPSCYTKRSSTVKLELTFIEENVSRDLLDRIMLFPAANKIVVFIVEE